MTIDAVMDMTREALFLVIQVSLPVLLVSLCVGLAVSIFQTVTSIQEQTLTFVPKILAVFVGIMLIGPWMLDVMSGYMTRLWSDFSVFLS